MKSDKIRRINWVRYFRNQPERMPEYFSKIFLSNECTSRLNGSVNTQNVRIGVRNGPYKGDKPVSIAQAQ